MYPDYIPQPQDWPEDFKGENGNYLNICFDCQKQFIGHKRRLWCKLCSIQDIKIDPKEVKDETKIQD